MVLVIEDNPDNLTTICAILENTGVTIEMARDGRGGVEKAIRTRPDIILMDIQLPGLSGLDATRELKANPSVAAIPIIAITAKAMRGDREKILSSGCDDYITKPIDPVLLQNMLGKWIK